MINIISGQSDLTISWDQNDESLLRGGDLILKTQERTLKGESKFSPKDRGNQPLYTL